MTSRKNAKEMSEAKSRTNKIPNSKVNSNHISSDSDVHVLISHPMRKDDSTNNNSKLEGKSHTTDNDVPEKHRRIRRISDVVDSHGESNSRRNSFSYAVNNTKSAPVTPTFKSSTSTNFPLPDVVDGKRLTDTDAGAFQQSVYGQGDNNFAFYDGVLQASMPVDIDAEEYNMDHPRRGLAVIINNDDFELQSMPRRDGSEADVKNLTDLYSSLGFEVVVHHNLEYSQINTHLTDLAKKDHSDADALIVTVLTHGLDSNFLLAKDIPYPVKGLWSHFTADKCLTLAGKPKIFVIQACRGERLDSGVQLVHHSLRQRTQTDGHAASYKIPTQADFLIAYSTVEGFYSFRHPENGTWFIECLCKELGQHAATKDLLSIMTRTARRMAVEYESYNDVNPQLHQQKQVPSINSMLIRDVYFRPKKR